MEPGGQLEGRRGPADAPGAPARAGREGRRPVRGRQAGPPPRARLAAGRRGDGGPGRRSTGTGSTPAPRCSRTIRNRWEVRPADGDRAARDAARGSPGSGRRGRSGCSGGSPRASPACCSPFRQLDDFVIRIESDEFPDYAGELRAEFLDQAPYRIEAAFDGEQHGRDQPERRAVRPAARGSIREPLAAAPSVHASSPSISRRRRWRGSARVLEVRAWLREWSGISVYRDGFRVWPYGEPHDDWLRLDQRRVNNPVVRLSNNQVVGFVEISRDRNPELRDQTNREGLLHNEAFADLRRLLHFVLEILEAAGRRSGIRRRPTDSASRRRQAQPGRKRPRDHCRVRRRLQRRHLEGWSELAAAGQAAALVSRAILPARRRGPGRARDASGSDLNGNAYARPPGGCSTAWKAHLGDLGRRRGIRSSTMHPAGPAPVAGPSMLAAELERVRDAAPSPARGVRRHDERVRPGRQAPAGRDPRGDAFTTSCTSSSGTRWTGSRAGATAMIRVTARPTGRPLRDGRRRQRSWHPTSHRRPGVRSAVLLARGRARHGSRRRPCPGRGSPGDISVVHDGRREGAAFRILLPRKRARSTIAGRT